MLVSDRRAYAKPRPANRTAARMTAIARRLLVLGAKPDPILPPPGSFDAVACANASGRSAAELGLPTPVFTVLTALLTDGSEAGRHAPCEPAPGSLPARCISTPSG